MASSSSSNKTSAVAGAYCVLSGLFFAACAYAQFNDPDPLFWILGYVVGGPVLCALTIAANGKATVATQIISSLVDPFLLGNAIVVMFWSYFMISKVDFALPMKDLIWSILEFEEGRELAGLLLLLLHVMQIKSFLKEISTSSTTSEKLSKSKDDDATTAKSEARNGTLMASSGLVATICLTATLIGSIYLWVYYQPAMVQKYQTPHCSGQFGSVGSSSGSSTPEFQ